MPEFGLPLKSLYVLEKLVVLITPKLEEAIKNGEWGLASDTCQVFPGHDNDENFDEVISYEEAIELGLFYETWETVSVSSTPENEAKVVERYADCAFARYRVREVPASRELSDLLHKALAQTAS